MRFVFLAFLLILMPLAWLSWVFPLMKSNWDKWWSNFLKWVFFAPVCIFFLYLAVLSTQQKTSQKFLENYGQSQNTSAVKTDAVNALSRLTNANTGLLNAIAQMFVLLGLAFGGLFAANSLSITGAATAMGAVKAGGKAAGGWARKRVGGGMARFATQTPPPKPPANAGIIGKMQHSIATSRLGMGARNVVQAVTTSNRAVEMGVTEKLLKYGGSTTPAHEEVKTKRREGWEKLQKAKSQAPIAELEKEAEGWENKIHGVEKLRTLETQAEAKEKEKDGVLLDSDKAKLQQEADALRNEAKLLATTSKELADAYATKKYTEAITDLTHEMGKVIDTARTEAGKLPNAAELLTLIDKKEVRKQQDTLTKESEEAWASANKMAKANPTLIGAVYTAVEKAVTGHGKMSDHSKHELAEAIGIKMAHDDHDDHGGGGGGDSHGAHATPAAGGAHPPVAHA